MIWVVGLYLLIMVFRNYRIRTPMLAVAAAGIWFVYLYVGSTFFDWTA